MLIAAPERLRALSARASADTGELLTFTDVDALRALEVIVTRRPSTVAIEHSFAATPRGVALMNRLKADPSLAASRICIVSDELPVPARARGQVGPRAGSTESGGAPPSRTREPGAAGADGAGGPHGMDAAGGTDAVEGDSRRQTGRIPIVEGIEVMVDGSAAALVELSAVGAQVISRAILKPNQRVRFSVSDEFGTWRMMGTVTWATFEIPPRYRAGIEFIDPNPTAIHAFIQRHRA